MVHRAHGLTVTLILAVISTAGARGPGFVVRHGDQKLYPAKVEAPAKIEVPKELGSTMRLREVRDFDPNENATAEAISLNGLSSSTNSSQESPSLKTSSEAATSRSSETLGPNNNLTTNASSPSSASVKMPDFSGKKEGESDGKPSGSTGRLGATEKQIIAEEVAKEIGKNPLQMREETKHEIAAAVAQVLKAQSQSQPQSQSQSQSQPPPVASSTATTTQTKPIPDSRAKISPQAPNSSTEGPGADGSGYKPAAGDEGGRESEGQAQEEGIAPHSRTPRSLEKMMPKTPTSNNVTASGRVPHPRATSTSTSTEKMEKNNNSDEMRGGSSVRMHTKGGREVGRYLSAIHEARGRLTKDVCQQHTWCDTKTNRCFCSETAPQDCPKALECDHSEPARCVCSSSLTKKKASSRAQHHTRKQGSVSCVSGDRLYCTQSRCYCSKTTPEHCDGRFWCDASKNRCECSSRPKYNDETEAPQHLSSPSPPNQPNANHHRTRCQMKYWCPSTKCYCTNKLPLECNEGSFYCNFAKSQCACVPDDATTTKAEAGELYSGGPNGTSPDADTAATKAAKKSESQTSGTQNKTSGTQGKEQSGTQENGPFALKDGPTVRVNGDITHMFTYGDPSKLGTSSETAKADTMLAQFDAQGSKAFIAPKMVKSFPGETQLTRSSKSIDSLIKEYSKPDSSKQAVMSAEAEEITSGSGAGTTGGSGTTGDTGSNTGSTGSRTRDAMYKNGWPSEEELQLPPSQVLAGPDIAKMKNIGAMVKRGYGSAFTP
ncbi:hypothetical protein AAMO2058_000493400 [Amorphochlora amoebiformis]